jgi:hypothetical protein
VRSRDASYSSSKPATRSDGIGVWEYCAKSVLYPNGAAKAVALAVSSRQLH